MNKNRYFCLAFTAVLSAIIMTLHSISIPRLLNGTVVNMFIILIYTNCGLKYSIIFSIIIPISGVITGFLPPAAIAMFPVLMIGYSLIGITYHFVKSKNIFVKVIFPAISKSFFIFTLSYIIFKFYHIKQYGKLIVNTIIFYQTLTAITGIFIAEKMKDNKPLIINEYKVK